MNESRPVKLLRLGASQVIEVPPAFELPGDGATMRKEGSSLIIDAENKVPLLELLAGLKPIDDDFGDIPELPLDPPPEFN